MEKEQIQLMQEQTPLSQITKFDFLVCFMHEEFDWGKHIFSDQLSTEWYHKYSNINVSLCRRYRKDLQPTDLIPLWNPNHVLWFQLARRRFDYYSIQLASYQNEVYNHRIEGPINYREIIPMQVQDHNDLKIKLHLE